MGYNRGCDLYVNGKFDYKMAAILKEAWLDVEAGSLPVEVRLAMNVAEIALCCVMLNCLLFYFGPFCALRNAWYVAFSVPARAQTYYGWHCSVFVGAGGGGRCSATPFTWSHFEGPGVIVYRST